VSFIQENRHEPASHRFYRLHHRVLAQHSPSQARRAGVATVSTDYGTPTSRFRRTGRSLSRAPLVVAPALFLSPPRQSPPTYSPPSLCVPRVPFGYFFLPARGIIN